VSSDFLASQTEHLYKSEVDVQYIALGLGFFWRYASQYKSEIHYRCSDGHEQIFFYLHGRFAVKLN
jgi:hypothetical protein